MSQTKDKMIQATAEAIRRRGVAGSSFSEVLRSAGASRGVIYHHFPGGKQELVEAAVARTGERVGRTFSALEAAEPTPEGLVRAFLDLVRPIVAESAGGAGCAVAGVVTEADPGTPPALAGRDALRVWHRELAGQLAQVGMSSLQAGQYASLLLAMLEGAYVLCRAEGTVEPFDAAGEALLQASRPA